MDEKLLLEQIDAFVAENRENVLRDLKALVDINSVEGPTATAGQATRLVECAATAMSWAAAWPTTKAPLY